MDQAQDFDPHAFTKPSQLTKTMRRADIYEAVNPTKPKNSAAGKSVLVTGGGRGIGKGITLAWAKAGAKTIFICGREQNTLDATAAEVAGVSPSTEVVCIPCDVTNEVQVAEMFAKVKGKVGKLDALVCNAGGMRTAGQHLKIGEMETRDWWGDIELNVKGTYLPVHYYIRSLSSPSDSPNTPPTGTIISISSIIAGFVLPGESSYGLAKRTNAGLVEYLHAEHPSIRAFSLNPGIVRTRDLPKPMKPYALDTPELAGAVTVYLASERSEYARGGFLSVNWDVGEMEQHAEEIERECLLKFRFLGAQLGFGGHP